MHTFKSLYMQINDGFTLYSPILNIFGNAAGGVLYLILNSLKLIRLYFKKETKTLEEVEIERDVVLLLKVPNVKYCISRIF